MEKYLELTKSLIKEFDNSKSSSLEMKIENYSLSLRKEDFRYYKTENFESQQVEVSGVNNVEPTVEVMDKENKGEEIKSPLVGVFYSSKDPESKPFVFEGKQVKKGDVICILESMKMMNEIKSPFDGIIKKVCCKNEELVEFEQVLFILEKINA
ncbi:acetyl-CoA carboxylase biotin carboxyl carrier protein [Peptoniphilus indolicus]|uniref:Biotin carboxyl carrier protein of acetyl-CoA carboxylase n=2 Tax=Peptoniphilus indolicus TaxID=33030 RepID=G4D454_9FIRM|nr:acetyl-CoA carboxylase biotin carboxyl carrier protein subunit [Peptoniphilus indolicus]EGY79659.1 acetyl-CoA carboxylase biotin carboxyl carrier subunit [Peptoniphilus indolicus ATCC 29427]SUB75875.1 Biotin carboxyl carrier protein of acetyl-CoA carboxylase [Peptoniphilus indolicus]